MTPRRLPVTAAVLTAGVLLVPVPVASAQAAPIEAAPSAEAWYRTLPVPAPPEADPCALPTGCAPALPAPLPSQYAAGTLHVGVAGGAEESRTYLTLDLSAVGFGSEVTGGTLTLPVATDPQAGTTAPETAVLRACLVTAPVEDGVDGAPTGAPEVDCATSSDAVYAAVEGQPAVFTVDLAPFAAGFSGGTSSLALVPGEEPGTNWHTAFSRRDRQAEGALPITAELQVTEIEQPGAFDADPPPLSTFDAPAVPPDSASFGSGASFAAPPLATSPQEQPLTAPVTPEVAAPTASVPVAALLGGPFAYPAVFLLPLLVAAAVGWAGRAFTRELVPARI